METIKAIFKKSTRSLNSYSPYHNREERALFISKLFKNFILDSILDVGCGDKLLKKHLPPNVEYIGVDINGTPDYIIDLEKDGLQKFEDNSFYTIICTDVLEHLNNLHDIFDELCRVSKKYIIVSLPNNWINFKFFLISGTGGEHYYGLPIEKPKDRHKWFFNYDEAYTFLYNRGKKHNFKVLHNFPIPVIHQTLLIHILNLFFKVYYRGKFGYNNLFYSSLWVLLEKN